jgi:hypothetical protein
MQALACKRRCSITVISNAFPLRCPEERETTVKSSAWDRFRRGTGDFLTPYYLDQRSDMPEQYRAIGWVGPNLYSLIFEMREDSEGEFYHLVTLWKSTREEQELYAEDN